MKKKIAIPILIIALIVVIGCTKNKETSIPETDGFDEASVIESTIELEDKLSSDLILPEVDNENP